MAQAHVIPRMSPSTVIEGTPKEIAAHLEKLDDDERLTLIIPGKEYDNDETTTPPEGKPYSDMTFAEILAPAEKGFEESGMTEEALDAFIEAEVKAHRDSGFLVVADPRQAEPLERLSRQ